MSLSPLTNWKLVVLGAYTTLSCLPRLAAAPPRVTVVI